MPVKKDGQRDAAHERANEYDHERKARLSDALEHAGFVTKFVAVPPEEPDGKRRRERECEVQRIVRRRLRLLRFARARGIGDCSVFGRQIDDCRIRRDAGIQRNVPVVRRTGRRGAVPAEAQRNVDRRLLRACSEVERDRSPAFGTEQVLGVAVRSVDRIVVDGKVRARSALHIARADFGAQAINGIRRDGDRLHESRVVGGEVGKRDDLSAVLVFRNRSAYAAFVVLIGVELPACRQPRALGVHRKVAVIHKIAARNLIRALVGKRHGGCAQQAYKQQDDQQFTHERILSKSPQVR